MRKNHAFVNEYLKKCVAEGMNSDYNKWRVTRGRKGTNMYKLLIVEDERAIAQGIASGTPWESWGFCVAGVCSNGEEAIEFIRQDKPDLVMSDIRMPKIDGIALMQYLNENYPEIKIIILSGYNDFEYLKMSIRNNVAEYLLKPTDMDEFETVFAKMKAVLDQEGKRRREQERVLQDKTFNGLIKGYGYDEDIVEKSLCGAEEGRFGVLLFQMEGESPEDQHALYQQKLDVTQCLDSMQGGKWKDCIHAKYFCNYEEAITGFLRADRDLAEEKLADYIRELAQDVKRQKGISLFCGVSNLYEDYRTLPQCYEQAKCCIGQKLFQKEKEEMLFFRQIEDADFDYYQVAFDGEEILRCMISGDREGVWREIGGTFELLQNRMVKDYDYVNRMSLELLLVVSRKMLKYQVRPEKIMNENGYMYEDIYKKQTLEAKQEFLMGIFELFMEEWGKQQGKNSKTSELAKTIRAIVDEEYASNLLSLEYVAERVHKNAAYISKIFKNEFECNFSTYVADRRLEKSTELLENPVLKIYEISQQMGWADVSNYIKLFKKKYGMSPDEYRKILSKNG